jgi:hypothetical protein
MADESGLSPYIFACKGGLVLDQSTFQTLKVDTDVFLAMRSGTLM